jgi:hypothetical protein
MNNNSASSSSSEAAGHLGEESISSTISDILGSIRMQLQEGIPHDVRVTITIVLVNGVVFACGIQEDDDHWIVYV